MGPSNTKGPALLGAKAIQQAVLSDVLLARFVLDLLSETSSFDLADLKESLLLLARPAVFWLFLVVFEYRRQLELYLDRFIVDCFESLNCFVVVCFRVVGQARNELVTSRTCLLCHPLLGKAEFAPLFTQNVPSGVVMTGAAMNVPLLTAAYYKSPFGFPNYFC